jgi:hypothetical protein
MVIHPRSEVAAQVQRAAAVTLTELDPPAAPKERELVDRVKVQAGGGSVGELLSQASGAKASIRSVAEYHREMSRISASAVLAEQQARRQDLRLKRGEASESVADACGKFRTAAEKSTTS